MPLSPGDRVDRYEVLELLGSGGMGEVYRAKDPKLARLVALKILRVDYGGGAEGPGRLLREARAAAALSHPNVLAVFDVGEVREEGAREGIAFIAMELVVGKPLRAFIGDASVPMERRIAWLRDIAEALDAAHRAGVVHRDVKPENVMIRDDGVVKVLDFGIARRAAGEGEWSWNQVRALETGQTIPVPHLPTLTGQGTVVGTPMFMAPEQLRGEALDARVDQFAWGVVAYSLLTGKSPWSGGDSLALVSQILSEEPAAPAEVSAAVPRAVSDVVMRALAKERGQRFVGMGEAVEGLGRRFGDEARRSWTGTEAATGPGARRGGGAPAEGAGAGASAARRRWPARALAVAAAIAVVVGGAIGAKTWRAKRAGQTALTGPGAAAVAGAAGGCATNAECVHAHGGEAWHCHSKRHVCVPIASEDCKAYAEPHDAEAEDVVWIGGMFDLTAHPNESEARAADLARQDFARALGPSVARSGSLHARPLALVLCDERADGARVARHLVEDVEAPAILGFTSAEGAVREISTELLPNHVMAIVSMSQASELTSIPQTTREPRLVWRTTMSHAGVAKPLARFISDVLEPRARATTLGNRPLRVAVVGAREMHHDVVDNFFRELHFNGKRAIDNGDNFRSFTVEVDGGDSDEELIGALLAFAPNVIFLAYPPAMRVPGRLEHHWRGEARPIYLTSMGWTPIVRAFVGRDLGRRQRFFAATNAPTTITNAELVLRYNTAFPHDPVDRVFSPQPSYDAVYVLAYATYALGDAVVTGPALSSAIDRLLPPGRPIDVGPAAIYEGFATLRSGGRIDLAGAIGSLDFNRTTGEAPIDYAITCLEPDEKGGVSDNTDSGLIFDSRADGFVGELHCR